MHIKVLNCLTIHLCLHIATTELLNELKRILCYHSLSGDFSQQAHVERITCERAVGHHDRQHVTIVSG